MTTIAYNHKDKEIAVDSRTSCGSTIITDNCNKVIKRNGLVFIGCGSVPNIEKLTESYPNGVDAAVNLDVTLYVVDRGKVFRCGQNDSDGFWYSECTVSRTEGTGADFALASMDYGCSARDAVKYASTRDIYTGGKIRVIKVK